MRIGPFEEIVVEGLVLRAVAKIVVNLLCNFCGEAEEFQASGLSSASGISRLLLRSSA